MVGVCGKERQAGVSHERGRNEPGNAFEEEAIDRAEVQSGRWVDLNSLAVTWPELWRLFGKGEDFLFRGWQRDSELRATAFDKLPVLPIESAEIRGNEVVSRTAALIPCP